MYGNNVELLFWPNSQRLAKWMHADKAKAAQDKHADPTKCRLVSGATTYADALEIILGQVGQHNIILADDLATDMMEAAKEKDAEDEEETRDDEDQVFLGVVINTVH